MAEYGISPIDLVVVNLYPFESDPSIELIDIGGPAMVRAAAKNHATLRWWSTPSTTRRCSTRSAHPVSCRWPRRRRLARDAFAAIAAYDAQIATWFDERPIDDDNGTQPDVLPAGMHLSMIKQQSLRYGENPHQQGARYLIDGRRSWWDDAVQHGGKELSYLNLYDTEAAWRMVQRFDEPACVIVKHANPCGVAVSARSDRCVRPRQCVRSGQRVRWHRRARTGRCRSRWRRHSHPSSPRCHRAIVRRRRPCVFAEKGNLRVLVGTRSVRHSVRRPFDRRRSVGAAGRHDRPRPVALARGHRATQPTDAQWDDLAFAWTVCAAVSSNAIVYAKDRQAFGIGAGQQNRLDSARIAAERSAGRADGGVCASDAFFPFRDGLDAAASGGHSRGHPTRRQRA